MAISANKATAGGAEEKRGKAPTLTEEQIVSAALSIIRAEGLDALSMRRLSRELDRSAMAPYWYVSDKRGLLDLVANRLLSEVEVPPPDHGSWDVRLRAVLIGIDERLHSYPGVASVLLERMTNTDRSLLNGIFEILVSAGFKGRDVFLSYSLIHTYLFGRYQVQQLRNPEDLSTPEDLEDTLASLVPYMHGLRGRDFFTYGVDTIIAGLRARLTEKPKPRKRSTQ